MKTIYLLIALLFFGFVSINAQSKETKEKIKKLKGDVTKITIETTEGEVAIEGEDAIILYKKLKSHKQFKIKHMDGEDLSRHGNVVIIKKGKHSGDVTINIDAEMDKNDGEKVVVIKKNIDGKEVVEKYKGEEAEKFLEEHSDSNSSIKFITEDGDIHVVTESDDNDLVWITEGEGKEVEKKINIEIKDGVKKVTVTTNKDGKEKVEVFKGEDAEKYLKKNTHHNKVKVNVSEDGDKNIMKKIIIIEDHHGDNDSDDNDSDKDKDKD